MTPGESTDERDRRVAKLWESLGVPKDGRLDLNGLKKGLKKVDHRKFSQVIPRHRSSLDRVSLPS